MAKFERVPIDQNFAALRTILAGKNLDERGLAGAVFTNQGVDFASLDREAHIVDSDLTRERLGDAVERKQRRASTGAGARPCCCSFLPVARRVGHSDLLLHAPELLELGTE